MPMAPIPGFVGASYLARSRGAIAERTVNMRVERNPQEAKSPFTLYVRAGKKKFTDLGSGAGFGAWAGHSRVFMVAGGQVFEVFQDGTKNFIGNVDIGSNPATMRANGTQLVICSAGKVYVATGTTLFQPIINFASGTVDVDGVNVTWDTGDQFTNASDPTGDVESGDFFLIDTTLYTVDTVIDATHLTLTGAAPTQTGVPYQVGSEMLTGANVEFIDGYFIVGVPNTKTFRISNFEDGKKWDDLDFQTKNGSTDNIASVQQVQGNLILCGDTNSCEIWGDSGNADFPFTRVSGKNINVGVDAPWSIGQMPDGSVIWLMCSDAGNGIVVRSFGGDPSRISDHALENAIRGYSRIDDAIGSVYLENGHIYYRIDFPTANRSWEYDATDATQGGLLPAAPGHWVEIGVYTPDDEVYGCDRGRYRVHVTWPNETRMALALDYASGTVWQVDPDFLDDDGVDFPVMRVAPPIASNLDYANVKTFKLDCEMGTIGQSVKGADGKQKIPTVQLLYSNDGSYNWLDAGAASLGRSGEYEGTYPVTPDEPFDTTPNSQTNPQVFEASPQWHSLGGFWVSRTFKIKSTGSMLRAVYNGLVDIGK